MAAQVVLWPRRLPAKVKKKRTPPMCLISGLSSVNGGCVQTISKPSVLPENPADRRRRPRYRFSVPVTIRSADSTTMQGMTIEISESGISVITADSLNINDTVELGPIYGNRLSARVRYQVGRVYGFEFIRLTAEQSRAIVDGCKTLARYPGNSLRI